MTQITVTEINQLTGPTMHNGLQTPRSTNELISISEIKEKAMENAHKVARGASAMSLIKTARVQVLAAQEYELSGDLKGALSALIKAGTLAQMLMNSAEFGAESAPGKKGVLYKEFSDFSQVSGAGLHRV
jgi:ubiquitin carboxyl-terminal hydrolase 8